MTTFDLSPLFRTSVGFDRLASMLNSAHRAEPVGGYPPYNIVAEAEDTYRITMAVAGFSRDEISITTEMNQLTVTGEKAEEPSSESTQYLYRGIATRSFERRFNLADHVRVTGARLDNGLLHIELEREIPEIKKPRNIEIHSGGALLENEGGGKHRTARVTSDKESSKSKESAESTESGAKASGGGSGSRSGGEHKGASDKAA